MAGDMDVVAACQLEPAEGEEGDAAGRQRLRRIPCLPTSGPSSDRGEHTRSDRLHRTEADHVDTVRIAIRRTDRGWIGYRRIAFGRISRRSLLFQYPVGLGAELHDQTPGPLRPDPQPLP
ncbi:hypothetical protein FRAAL4668 [Frankia alni ACN14a]|uniref:Uncharacterized protein n=1 Tax=Frankia alni (strain DSM 45986 / CECT 9034 / ACN14a) TaxID=326424 RepID=Q0RGS6_FRAAA|nr:hypothetical protein FRAAL4668 [Frankia alni ACN14a]